MKKVIKTLIIVPVLILDCFLGYKIYTELSKPSMSDLENELLGLDKIVRENTENVVGINWVHNKFEDIVKECGEVEFNLEKEELTNKIISLTVKDTRENDINTEWENRLLEYVSVDGYEINDFPMKNKPERKLSIELKTSVNNEKLSENITNLLDSLVIDMVGAKGQLVNGVMEVTNEGQEGRTYSEEDKDKIIKEIEDSIKNDIFKDINVSLVYDIIDIKPTADSIRSIDTKLSSFSTSFAPGGSRGTNVSLAASRLNGVLLGPGEMLSVDKQILSRNKANGYQPAGSYQNGRTVQTYGGGVCQVSTTLYGAVLRAGIIPTERNAHSMAVSYVPLGLDAAIAEGFKDLKVTNTYDKPIYIEGYTRGGTLTFNVYGNSELLNGYTYKPVSSANGLHATAKLQKIKDGSVVESIQLPSSSYRPHG